MKQDELFSTNDYDHKNYNRKNVPYFDERLRHEVHRMMGFLRFKPDKNGVYIARCAPDYFILPFLTDYFTQRFGETPWEIIDEKRGISLSCKGGKGVKLEHLDKTTEEREIKDEWENLWKHYHKVINNKNRQNPKLQRQFMPKRYWKYLPEQL